MNFDIPKTEENFEETVEKEALRIIKTYPELETASSLSEKTGEIISKEEEKRGKKLDERLKRHIQFKVLGIVREKGKYKTFESIRKNLRPSTEVKKANAYEPKDEKIKGHGDAISRWEIENDK